MNTKGLIFIPDISGFTRFVNEVEIDHSRHIIQELLEVIINSNLEIKNKTKVLSFYREYDADIIALLHGVVDFHTRKLWNVGIKDIDNVTHGTLPRLGTSHRCILEKGHSIFYSSSYSFTP